jgi:uncharacterized membrane protein
VIWAIFRYNYIKKGAKIKRVIGIDVLRGIAILMMISFHFCYDLQYFEFYNFQITSNPFFLNYRLVIVNLFLFIVGVSLYLANQNGINWQKVQKRALILFGASALITVVTYFIFPKSWVYFGVIHFIFVASLAALAFIKHPFLALVGSIAIAILYFGGFISMHPLFNYLADILHLPKYHTEDLVPFIPWFATVLAGVAFGGFKLFRFLDIKENFITSKVALLGKHALLIYLVHQPILFALLYTIKATTN